MKVYKGNILTVNQKDDVAKYLVEDEGRIIFVGNELPDQYKSASTVDLGVKALIPPFVIHINTLLHSPLFMPV